MARASAALSIGLLAGACQQGTEGTRPSAPQGTIDYLMWGVADPNEAEAQRRLVDQFTTQHPGVQVNAIDTTNTNYFEKLTTLLGAGTPPDVMVLYDLVLPPYADKGSVLPLDDHFKADRLDRGQFYPSALQALQWGGKQAGMPINAGPIITLYNQGRFEQVGQRPPPADGSWTWAQLVEAAKRLTQADQRLWGTFFSTDLGRWLIYVYANGGQPFDKDDNPSRSNLTDGIVVQAAEEWFGLVTRHRVAPGPEVVSADRALHFRDGNYAMDITAGPWRKGEWGLDKVPDLKWDVAPLPKGTRSATTLAYVNGLEIAAASRQPDAAWALVKFHVSEPAQQMMGPINGRVPSIKRVAESEAYLGATPPKSIRVYLETLRTARAVPRSPVMNDLRTTINRAMGEAYAGRVTAREALQQAHPLVQKLFDDYWASRPKP